MDVFVTGGSGFVGRHLLAALAEAGYRTRALARSDAAAATVSELGAAVVWGDLADRDALDRGVRGCGAVVHAAALTPHKGTRGQYQVVNVEGTIAVVDAARRSGVPRLVHVSSEAVLADGRALVHVDENQPRPARLLGEYPRTKALAEELVMAATEPDFITVSVRPRLIWGPGDTTVLPEILKAGRTGRFAWIDGGRYLTSTCHVANVCAGILAAMERGRGGQAYFLTDGEPIEFRRFIGALAATAGVTLPDRSIPRWLLSGIANAGETICRMLRLSGDPPVTHSVLALSAQEMTVDDSRARVELGYRNRITRADGLAQLAGFASAG